MTAMVELMADDAARVLPDRVVVALRRSGPSAGCRPRRPST